MLKYGLIRDGQFVELSLDELVRYVLERLDHGCEPVALQCHGQLFLLKRLRWIDNPKKALYLSIGIFQSFATPDVDDIEVVPEYNILLKKLALSLRKRRKFLPRFSGFVVCPVTIRKGTSEQWKYQRIHYIVRQKTQNTWEINLRLRNN